MRLSRFALAAVAAFLFIAAPVVAASVAIAQEAVPAAPSTALNVGELIAPWLEMLVGAAAILITAILGWIAALVRRKTGVDIDLARMQTLQKALENAAGILIAKAGDAVKDVNIDVRNPMIRDAILYVNKAAPDAVKRWNLTPEDLAEKLVAKIGTATAPVVKKDE